MEQLSGSFSGSVAMMAPTGGKLERILVCDDTAAVLHMVTEILKRANFDVLSAGSGADALKIGRETDRKIDLLLSDVEMPEMTGPALGQEMKKIWPDIHVMLMSGGAQGNLLVLNYGWAYIQKPFLVARLVQMVTEVLHSRDRSQSSDEFDSRKDTGAKD